PLDI
ncbi:hypothetical protein VCHENC02_0343B, partial [Vibrio harveyi]